MSNSFKVIVGSFIIIVIISIFYGSYFLYVSIPKPEASLNEKYETNKTLEIKEFLEKDKRDREKWEKQNPRAAKNLNEKDSNSTTAYITRIHLINSRAKL